MENIKLHDKSDLLIEDKNPKFIETKTSHLDDLLQEKLEKSFHKETATVSLHDMTKIASEHSPIDLAYAVAHLPPNARPVLYDNLPNRDAKIKFILNTDSATRLRIFRFMNDQEMKKLFEKMPTDEAVWVLEDMSERRFRRVMELIEPKKAIRIKEQKEHKRNSAGRLMTTEYFAFNMNMTIGQAALYIRDYPNIDFSRGVYLINDEKEIQGYVPGRNLIINKENIPLRQVMRPVLHKVTVEASREEVVDIVERYKIQSLPVIDENNHIIGVIAHEDVLEVMEDLADETIGKIAGTAEKMHVSEGTFKRFFARAPWLIVTLLAGLVNVGIMSSFESKAKGILTFVLFFVPLITGMSGNIGIQCSTVLVRSMALGIVSAKTRGEIILKEFYVGIVTGIIFGLACGMTVYLISSLTVSNFGASAITVGVIVGTGLIGACFAGTLLGVSSPLFFYRIGVDPAISSGPIVTAFNDIVSMAIYFIIAHGLGKLFLG